MGKHDTWGRRTGFRELTEGERGVIPARLVMMWEWRRSGVSLREVAARMKINPGTVSDHLYRIRDVLDGHRVFGRGKGGKPPRVDVMQSSEAPEPPLPIEELDDQTFDAMCAHEESRDQRAGLLIPGMQLQDFQRCTHCGLRGHLPEACDLPLVRGEIVLGRRSRIVEEER